MENQQEIWDKIAPEWHEYKQIPAEHTIKFLKKQKGNVLDLGSGSGRHLAKIKSGRMYLVDFSKEMISLAKKKAKKLKIPAEFAVADLTKLPYENNFFNSAIAISSLHCISKKNQLKVVKELFRVLKPGAKAEIGVWNIKSKRFKNSPKEKLIAWTTKGKRYYYLFDEKEIHDLFKKAGFKILSGHNTEMMINFIVEKTKV
ncbi:MAG TPA: class I SAM-dependent methyltransferase [Candidatus Nanoarchaeia archaeon]|nr:class I SAM-dependent methyltransferase [Candidatus Nanoarchaeia archaeon]